MTTSPPATAARDTPAPRDLFDRARRAQARNRAATMPDGSDFLAPLITESLIDRLSMVTRSFADVLVIGALNRALIAALRARGGAVTLCEAAPGLAAATGADHSDEDRIAFPRHSFDLIVWPGGMDSVNDVPGAIMRARAMLRPDGLLIGSLVGDGSFPMLRRAMQVADGDRGVARMHPQIDVRTLGDLLQRTGFAMPVADVETLDVTYRSLDNLVRDVRAAALGCVLAGPRPPLSKAGYARAAMAFAEAADANGRTRESIRLLHFSGWAPDAGQPLPARRGSATASLADVLKAPRRGEGKAG